MNVKDRPRIAFGRALIALGMFLMVPAVLLISFGHAVLDSGYHMRLYDMLRSAEAAGITHDELQATSDMIVDYLQGQREDLSLSVMIDGIAQPIFNEREIVHMRDVRMLFDLERQLCAVFFCSSLAGLFLGIILTKKERFWQIQTKGLLMQGVWIVLLTLVVVYIISDFSRAFGLFHELLFRNDLWLLNPATDRMIRMMPEAFFSALARRGALFMGGGMVCMFAAYSAPYRIYKWRTKKT